jgi:hypothetical protein
MPDAPAAAKRSWHRLYYALGALRGTYDPSRDLLTEPGRRCADCHELRVVLVQIEPDEHGAPSCSAPSCSATRGR